MAEKPYPRLDVTIPPEVIAEVDRIGKITTGISGVIDATIVDKERHITSGAVDIVKDSVGLAKESTLTDVRDISTGIHGILDSRLTKCDTDSVTVTTGQVGVLSYPNQDNVANLDVALSTRASEATLAEVRDHTTGIQSILDTRLIKCDSDNVIVTSGDVKVTNLHGEFAQYNNESVASGSTNTYGPFTIDWAERKTVGVWVNTGDISVKILVSNDGTTFYDYYSKDVTSGSSATMSFTESFASMRVEVLGSTDAGYNLLVSRQV